MADAEIERWNMRASAALLVAIANARVRSALENVTDAVREIEALREAARGALQEFHDACADAERAARLWGAAADRPEDTEEALAWNRPTTSP